MAANKKTPAGTEASEPTAENKSKAPLRKLVIQEEPTRRWEQLEIPGLEVNG